MDTKEEDSNQTRRRWTIVGRPNIYWGWVVTIASSIMFLVAYGFLYSFGIIMVELMNEFESSATKTGYIGTMAYGLSSLSCIVSAPLTVKLGYRLASMIGLTLCLISCIVTSFSPGLSLMFFSHGFLYGFGASLMVCGGINVTISHFPGKHQSLATALSSAGANAGVLTMNPLVNALNDRYGWRNMFRIISAILAVVGVPSILTFSPASKSLRTSKEDGANEEKYAVLDANGKASVGDINNVSDHTFEKAHPDGCDESTHVWKLAGQGGNVKDKRTVLNPTEKSLENHDETLNGSFKDGSRTDEQSTLLVANGTDLCTNSYHNVNGSVMNASNLTNSQEPHTVPHLNGANSPHLASLLVSDTSETESRPIKPAASDVASEVQEGTYWRRLTCLLRMPDVWFLEMGLLMASVGLSFFLFSTANVIVTAGHSKKTASLVMAVIGLSEIFGKIIIGIVADRLPIPKIFIIMAANCVGALLLMVTFFIATKSYLYIQATLLGFFVMAALDSLPHSFGNQLFKSEFGVQIWALNMIFMGTGGIFGAVFGESVDKTGSYNAAFYGTIAIFIVSTICLGLTVLHQRFFARDRFFVFAHAGKRYARLQRNDKDIIKKEEKSEHCRDIPNCKESLLLSPPSLIVTDLISSV